MPALIVPLFFKVPEVFVKSTLLEFVPMFLLFVKSPLVSIEALVISPVLEPPLTVSFPEPEIVDLLSSDAAVMFPAPVIEPLFVNFVVAVKVPLLFKEPPTLI